MTLKFEKNMPTFAVECHIIINFVAIDKNNNKVGKAVKKLTFG